MESGVKTKPDAPTWTVCVGAEAEPAVVAAAAAVAEEEAEEGEADDELAPPPPYCARAGTRSEERKRADAVNVFILTDVVER